MILRAAGGLLGLAGLSFAPLHVGAGVQSGVIAGETSQVASVTRTGRTGAPPERRPAGPAGLDRIVRRVPVARGDTLASLLAAAGLDHQAVARWSAAIRPVFDPRQLRVGRALVVEHDATGALVAVRYEIDDRATLVAERDGDDIAVRREEVPLTMEIRGVSGVVVRGLWQDVVDAGAPAAVASSLARVFGNVVDFRRIRPGDEFRVLYEVVLDPEEGRVVEASILGATLDVRGKRVTAIRFDDAKGRRRYYRPDGTALASTNGMLRYPVHFRRISSRFSTRRFHPILRRYRPHLGVDFAAPRGTPVRATAAGVVANAGWARGMGRMVRLRHGRGLETIYGHLARVAPGLRPGHRVQAGDVIGYVGATGLATGNHLHYGVRRNGRYVNPLAVGAVSVPAAALAPGEREAFAAVRDAVTQDLDRLGEDAGPSAVSSAADERTEG